MCDMLSSQITQDDLMRKLPNSNLNQITHQDFSHMGRHKNSHHQGQVHLNHINYLDQTVLFRFYSRLRPEHCVSCNFASFKQASRTSMELESLFKGQVQLGVISV